MYRIFKSMPLVLGLLALAFLSLVSKPSYAQDKEEKPLVACDQSKGTGEIFYDFDALIIFYSDFMYGENANEPSFPKPLKVKAFNDRLVKSIKNNFALCLRAGDGKAKPIYIILSSYSYDLGCENKDIFCWRNAQEIQKNWEMIHSPRNLTLLVRGYYDPRIEIAPGLRGYGSLLTYWYRRGVEHKLAQMPTNNKSTFSALLPVNGTITVDEQLEYIFQELTPRKDYSPEFSISLPLGIPAQDKE